MLVVTRYSRREQRRLGESVVVVQVPGGPTVRVTLVDVSPGRAKIGIEAPPEFLVLREELIEPQQGKENDHA